MWVYTYIPYHFEWLYIQSWQKNGKKNEKIKKNLLIISRALARSLICIYLSIGIYPITLNGYILQSWQKIKKIKKSEKIKKSLNNFWGQVLNKICI